MRHHIELAKYVNWPLAVSIIGPEQRGPDPAFILLSIWSEKPVPSHLGDEKASSLRLSEAFGTATGLSGTLIGELVTWEEGNAVCVSSAICATPCAAGDFAESSIDMSSGSGLPEATSVSSGLRLTAVPLRMCFGGRLRFLPCLAGDVPTTAVGESLQSGDVGLCDVGESSVEAQCLSLAVGLTL